MNAPAAFIHPCQPIVQLDLGARTEARRLTYLTPDIVSKLLNMSRDQRREILLSA